MTSRYLDQCRLGAGSESRLATCTPNLQRLIREVIRRAPKYLDFTVVCGHRGQIEQDEAYRTGRSKKPWPLGEHNRLPSRAIDIAPYPLTNKDWQDQVRFGRLVGFIEAVAVELGIAIRVGLDWDMDGKSIDETFQDLGHIEEAA